MKEFCRKLSTIMKEITELHVAVYAGNATFFILLSLFPAAMVLIAVIQYLPATVTDLQNLLWSITPTPIHSLISAAFSSLPASGSATIISAASVGTAWAVARAMVSMMNGLDVVYRAPKGRPFWQKVSIGFLSAILFFVCILGTLLLQVFGETVHSFVSTWSEKLALLMGALMEIRWPFTIGFLSLVFCLLYTVLPYRRQNFVRNIPGALVAAIGWLAYSALFGFYVEHFGNYANLYGSITAVVITMLWLYACINLVFYGGLLNYVLWEVPHPLKQTRDYFRK